MGSFAREINVKKQQTETLKQATFRIGRENAKTIFGF
jgi:hypothetical protein